ncbi:unnamed protein product [Albugo candida]|uniref:Uncharacterized protein n=2 Tax=Albugo candida TaxID=65357 RepID=A0A024GQ11_9STRA|nr:unnamed protein product [Albugo candida]|eukprot:CCI48414.1 unnamed protein product [Albugo candida]
MMHVEANEWSILAANEFLATLYRIYTVHPYWTSNMAFYRIGRSITMTRTLKREIKRKGQYMSESAICKLLKQRSFVRAVTCPVVNVMTEMVASNADVHSTQWLFFEAEEDDDGT